MFAVIAACDAGAGLSQDIDKWQELVKPETCGMFARRQAQCWYGEGTNGEDISNCLNIIEIGFPVGWYNRKGAEIRTISYFYSAIYNHQVDTSKGLLGQNSDYPIEPKPLVKEFKAFEDACPMYSKKGGAEHCCHFGNEGISEQAKADCGSEDGASCHSRTMVDQFATFEYESPAKIYTKCWNALKYLRCAMCHPNATYASYALGPRNADKEATAPIYAMRLCQSYADIIYDNCKDAVFYSKSKDFVVPPKFSREEFYQVVGHEWNSTFNDFQEPEWFFEDSGRCIDYSDYAESAGFMGMSVSSLLLTVAGIAGLISALF